MRIIFHKFIKQIYFFAIKLKIVRNGLFNKTYYLKNNPDIIGSGMSPLMHYLHFGGFEGRKPSAGFDSKYYLDENPDVKMAGVNPLVHYVSHGMKEGRIPCPDHEEWRSFLEKRISQTGNQHLFSKATEDFSLSFLIVAELSIPQCKKYRVDQKAEMIKTLGYICTVVDWHETRQVLKHLQTHTVVIFYRVPGTPEMLRVVKEAALLGVRCYYELDDLIFDRGILSKNPNLQPLDKSQINSLYEGATLYGKMLTACKNIIASTPYLAEQMQTKGSGKAYVIENAIDHETLDIIQRHVNIVRDKKIRIAYGSGTKTHDEDFKEALPAIAKILINYPEVELILAGEINIPPELQPYAQRINKYPAMPFQDYFDVLTEADISVAPLVDIDFNNAKSNIKYLEASAAGVPSVCSPSSAFKNIIQHGINGFLAETTEEWYNALKMLIHDEKLRHKIGEAARRQVMENHTTTGIALSQVTSICQANETKKQNGLRILTVNIFFPPNNYGGATIVAEEMTRYLAKAANSSAAVFTSAFPEENFHRDFIRTEYFGVPVFRVSIKPEEIGGPEYINPRIHSYFREAVSAFHPDIVHLHSLQGFGAGIADVCRQENIKYVVTLHDAWWLCPRQFQINDAGKYCGQTVISNDICAECIYDKIHHENRSKYLKNILNTAAGLFTPGNVWKDFYIANGILKKLIRVNENGIKLPVNVKPNNAGHGKLRFGFVGGKEIVKGFLQIKAAFEALESSEWELVIVDHHLKQFRHKNDTPITIEGRGKIRIIPKYTEETIESFFESIDVLLFPTLVPESFGLTVREALARNKWVIATKAGGIAEVIEDGINGTLIPLTNDHQKLQKAVEMLLSDQDMLIGWENPLRNKIRYFSEQAEEMTKYFYEII